jgi:hypothetical protein
MLSGRFSKMIAGVLFCIAILLPEAAFSLTCATGTSPLRCLVPHIITVRAQLWWISYGIAGIAILGAATATILGGKFRWGWLFAIIGSLALVALEQHDSGGRPGNGDFGEYVRSRYTPPTVDRIATNNDATADSYKLIRATSANSEQFFYGIAGLGALGLAVVAFMGRFRWGWLFAMIGGVLLVNGYELGGRVIASTNPFNAALAPTTQSLNLYNDDAELFAKTNNLANNTENNLKTIVYALGGMGALGLATLCFMGRFQWRWFFMILAGLALIAGYDQGVDYITD